MAVRGGQEVAGLFVRELGLQGREGWSRVSQGMSAMQDAVRTTPW